MTRKAFALLLAGIVAFGVSACGSTGTTGGSTTKGQAGDTAAGNGSPAQTAGDQANNLAGKTITIYATHVDLEGWDKLVQNFKQKTGITIKGVKAPSDYSANVQKLTVSLSSGDSGYDIIHVDELMAKNFQSAGFIAPFADQTFPADVRANFNQDELNQYSQKDGKYYAMPVNTSAMVLYANKDLFDKAGIPIPTTYDEFKAAAQKLTKADGSQYGYGASWSKGGQLFNDAIRWSAAFGGDYNNWKDPNTQKAFQAMHDFIYKDKITPKTVLGDSYDALTKNFIDGKYAMMYQWNGFSSQMGDKFGKSLVVIPNMKASTNKTIGASWFYAINKNSKNMDAANAFIQWSASEEGQQSLINLPDHSSGSKAVLKNSALEINKKLSQYLDANSVAGRPLTENVNELMDETETVLSKYLSDQISLEQTIADGQKILDKLMKK